MVWSLLLVLLAAMPAQAELLIRITEGVESAIPVAVVPFKESGSLPAGDKVSDIVRTDLNISGEFSTLAPEKMLSLPSRGDEVYFRDWRLLGQRYLLVGEIRQLADRASVRFELFDVTSEKRILGETAGAPLNNLRSLAHHISDKVYEAITGVPGVFSTRLAYVTLQSANGKPLYKLQVSDVDGKRSRVRLESDEPILSPAWSPDGRRLAYVSFETGKPAVYIHELASGQRTRIASFPGLNSAPAWSPDGRSLLLTLSKDGNAEIYKMDIASRSLSRLTEHWSIDTEASWAADGEGLFFTSDRSGGPQIYYKESERAEPRRITFGSRYNARPRPSADGKFVYYVHQHNGAFQIARTNLETGQETVLTRTQLDESPSVSPNGRMLIYATKQGGQSVLTVISSESGASYTLPASEGDVREPAWSPIIR
ncbi:MAG: Tol-Pal system beta propeller repeat protein TolB [Marinobacter sp.]|uniref:Tol-Pal system beta propeller repeat protein TolB n=1 Tax=Marinobacter sp. TaxID=50741 RepID=UPI00299EA2C4|nr:Tol-Pal system beta propeller repeat protein TolB [Marinobacter sp.]MDX1754851.1 Tol-Pal system beta propeller repeat protein TolB [Marinobacter sp.]